jgi:twitching motility protein PilT
MSLVNREQITADEALDKAQDSVVMREKLLQMGYKLREF